MFSHDSKLQPNDFLGDSKLRAYIIKPQKMWMNDAEEKNGLFHDYRVEIEL